MKDFTPEERAAMLEVARKSKEDKKAAGQFLKKDFLDEQHWRKLASSVGFRLAAGYISCSETKYAKRLLKHLGRDSKWFTDLCGFRKMEEFYQNNPSWPAYAMQGIILEAHFEEVANEKR